MYVIKLQIKPISINECFKGRRFKTPKYDTYIRQMMFLLPTIKNVPTRDIKVFIEFGYSSMLSDCDNGIKPFLDCLVKKYGFDDRYITQLNVHKKVVPKSEEYIIFEIS